MSWPSKNLGDIVDFLSGFAWKAANFSDDRSGVPIIRIQNVDSVRESVFVYWVDEYDSRFIVKEGDLLLTLSGSFRAEFWTGPDALLNQRIVKITPKSDIDRNWLMHSLRGALAQIEAMGRHALVNNVALSDLRQMQLSVPPLEEQKRIAAILDQADDIRLKRQHAIDRLNQLGQAIFHEMFGDLAIDRWLTAKLCEVAQIERNGISSEAIETGTKYLGLEHIESGGKILGFADVDAGELASTKFKFTSNHVLYGKLRPYLAKIALPDFDGICSTDIVPIKPKSNLDKRYLAYFLRQPEMVAFANSKATGANLPRLSPKALADFEIPLPPLEEQKLFADRVHEIDEFLGRMSEILAANDALSISLRHRAFTGQL